MKRVLILLLLAVLLLAGCSAKQENTEPYTVNIDDWGKTITLTVDPTKRTISDGTDLYTYRIRNVNEEQIIVIYYPNGETYECNLTSGNVSGYDLENYISGSILVNALTEYDQLKTNSSKEEVKKAAIIGPIFIIVGLATFFFPRLAWWRSWRCYPPEWRAEYTKKMERNLKIAGLSMAIFGVLFLLAVYFYAYL